MSSGRYCLIRDLGPVKGGKGLKHHEVVAEFTLRGLVRFAAGWLGGRLAGWKEQSGSRSWRRNYSQDATDVS
jgi:hypothetical protein